MVPGMTERERLAADVARLEWLAETRFGPTPPVVATPASPRAVSPLSLCRRALTAAFLFGQGVRPLATRGEAELAAPVSAPTRGA